MSFWILGFEIWKQEGERVRWSWERGSGANATCSILIHETWAGRWGTPCSWRSVRITACTFYDETDREVMREVQRNHTIRYL